MTTVDTDTNGNKRKNVLTLGWLYEKDSTGPV